jgi:hypothetical protein
MGDRLDVLGRRDMLRIACASAWGCSLSGWLPQLARAAETQPEPAKGRKSVILLWMAGGPSQTDTFDLKPGHANGGPFKEIATAAPDIRFSEHLPKLAAQAKDLAVIRSMQSAEGDHGLATKLMSTGYRQVAGALDYPALGAIVAKELGRDDDMLPGFVSISPFRFGDSGGAGFLGPNYAPLTVTGASDNPDARANLSIENLAPAGTVSQASLKKRFEILDYLQKDFGKKVGGTSAAAHRANVEKARRMIESKAKQAFQLEDEPAALRDAYGRNRFGQGCLLARRLVERGVSFVEVGLTGAGVNSIGWDTHADNFASVKTLCETLDPAWATLMTDLRDRGMLENTLVVWMGEFGRTPKINGNGGRDHWPDSWSTVLGGGGIKGGRVIGKTDAGGEKIVDRPVAPPDFLATICEAVGIDPLKENISTIGRPISIVDKDAKPIEELL